MKRRLRKPFPADGLRGAVQEVLASLGQTHLMSEARLLAAWKRIVGPQLASRTIPLRLASGVLSVGVFSSAWLGQLTFFREDLARKADECLGGGQVSSVRLQLQKKPSWWPLRRSSSPSLRELSPEDRSLIEQACAGISDPELRNVVLRILARQATLPGRD